MPPPRPPGYSPEQWAQQIDEPTYRISGETFTQEEFERYKERLTAPEQLSVAVRGTVEQRAEAGITGQAVALTSGVTSAAPGPTEPELRLAQEKLEMGDEAGALNILSAAGGALSTYGTMFAAPGATAVGAITKGTTQLMSWLGFGGDTSERAPAPTFPILPPPEGGFIAPPDGGQGFLDIFKAWLAGAGRAAGGVGQEFGQYSDVLQAYMQGIGQAAGGAGRAAGGVSTFIGGLGGGITEGVSDWGELKKWAIGGAGVLVLLIVLMYFVKKR